MRTIALAAVALLTGFAIAGCEQVVSRAVEAEPVRAGEVAFELAGAGDAAIVVPVRINGQGPFSFVLDTGATLTCLDRALADRLELEPAAGMRGIGAGIGGSGSIDLVRIDTLEVGNASARDLVACSIDLGAIGDLGIEAEGLLGLNFLKPFRMTIDFQRESLRLDRPGEPEPADSGTQ